MSLLSFHQPPLLQLVQNYLLVATEAESEKTLAGGNDSCTDY